MPAVRGIARAAWMLDGSMLVATVAPTVPAARRMKLLLFEIIGGLTRSGCGTGLPSASMTPAGSLGSKLFEPRRR